MVWKVKEMALLTKKISEMLGAAPGVKDFAGTVSSEVWKVDIFGKSSAMNSTNGLHIIFSILVVHFSKKDGLKNKSLFKSLSNFENNKSVMYKKYSVL